MVCSSLPPHLALRIVKGVSKHQGKLIDLVAPLVLCRTGAARFSGADA
jgi:hypothetical protein